MVYVNDLFDCFSSDVTSNFFPMTPNSMLKLYLIVIILIIIISSLPKGRSLANKFSNYLGFQPSSSYPHMSHLIHRRSCPFLAFPLVSFLPFSLPAPISSDHLPLQHVQSSSSFCPISFLLSFSFRSWSRVLVHLSFIHP